MRKRERARDRLKKGRETEKGRYRERKVRKLEREIKKRKFLSKALKIIFFGIEKCGLHAVCVYCAICNNTKKPSYKLASRVWKNHNPEKLGFSIHFFIVNGL